METDQEPIGFFTHCSFTVTVLPEIPRMVCPLDTTVYTCDPDGAIVNYAVPTAGSGCGALDTFLSVGLPPGDRFRWASRWCDGSPGRLPRGNSRSASST
jgi:hypothetical protein